MLPLGMKKILFITMSPIDSIYSCATRNAALIQGLVEIGFGVDVVTVHNRTGTVKSVPVFDNPSVSVRYLDSPVPHGVIERGKSQNGRAVAIARWIYHRFFVFEFSAKSIWRNACSLKTGLNKQTYEFVISSSDPKNSHRIASVLIQGLKGAPKWIQYWGDPLAIDITRKLVYPRKLLKAVENHLLSSASRIVYTSPVTLEDQRNEFPLLAGKMTSVPTPSFERASLNEPKVSPFVVGYHGSYNPRIRNIRPLIDAISRLGDGWRLQIVGPHSRLDFPVARNVEVHGPVAKLDQYEQVSSVLVVLLNSKGTQIPGKVYHLAGLNRHILVLIDGDRGGEIRDYLESFSHYHICENTSDAIAQKLIEIQALTPKALPSTKFRPAVIARQFLASQL